MTGRDEVVRPGAGESRFARHEAIRWWDQGRLQSAKVLVVGAGALGNEIIKNLALLGVGNLFVVDLDNVETSNLCRSVLFREADEGQPKAHAAARAVRDILPGTNVHAIAGNVLCDVGLGCFRWADIVVGAVDNREARVFINRACAETGRPWLDGGLDVLDGIARGFAPPGTACYECTMGQVDWDLLNARRSCTLLARAAHREFGTPTTATVASIIGGILAQELVKMLHGLEALLGRGYLFEGRAHQSCLVEYPVAPHCPWHEAPAPVIAHPGLDRDTPLLRAAAEGRRELGGLDAIDFSREIVESLECPVCRRLDPTYTPLDRLTAAQAVCDTCGGERAPRFLHSLAASSAVLGKSPRELGLPDWDVVWARFGDRTVGIEMQGDREAVLAGLPPAGRRREA